MLENRKFSHRAVAWAWLSATLFSGLPSTLFAWVSGADVLEATRAAGLMLLRSETRDSLLLPAAAIVHASVSLFWAIVLSKLLPKRHVLTWAVVASAMIAILDLKLIAPAMFPLVAELAFMPQFADHIMWGICYGSVLAYLSSRPTSP